MAYIPWADGGQVIINTINIGGSDYRLEIAKYSDNIDGRGMTFSIVIFRQNSFLLRHNIKIEKKSESEDLKLNNIPVDSSIPLSTYFAQEVAAVETKLIDAVGPVEAREFWEMFEELLQQVKLVEVNGVPQLK